VSWQRLQNKSPLIFFCLMNILIPHKPFIIQQQISLLSSQAQAWLSSSYYAINLKEINNSMLYHQVSFWLYHTRFALEVQLMLQSWRLLFKMFEASGRFSNLRDLSPKFTCHHLTPNSRYAISSTDKPQGQWRLQQQEHLWIYMKMLIQIVMNFLFVVREQRKQTLVTKHEILL